MSEPVEASAVPALSDALKAQIETEARSFALNCWERVDDDGWFSEDRLTDDLRQFAERIAAFAIREERTRHEQTTTTQTEAQSGSA